MKKLYKHFGLIFWDTCTDNLSALVRMSLNILTKFCNSWQTNFLEQIFIYFLIILSLIFLYLTLNKLKYLFIECNLILNLLMASFYKKLLVSNCLIHSVQIPRLGFCRDDICFIYYFLTCFSVF